MKRYTLGFVIVLIATVSFFMHRASIKSAEITAGKQLAPLVINVDNQSAKDITLIGTYKSSVIKSGEAPKVATKISDPIKAKSKGVVRFETMPGFDWLEVKQETKPVIPLHSTDKPLTTQSILIK